MNSDRMGRKQGTVHLAGWFLTAVAACALLAGHAFAGGVKVVTRPDCFTSEGHPIGVEMFAPEADGKYPAFILLHAIDGLDTGYGDHYRKAAVSFAKKGYVVDLVHYFDRTGTRSQDVADQLVVERDALVIGPVRDRRNHGSKDQLTDQITGSCNQGDDEGTPQEDFRICLWLWFHANCTHPGDVTREGVVRLLVSDPCHPSLPPRLSRSFFACLLSALSFLACLTARRLSNLL